ncbi:hypothetical protein H0H92_005942, partial [Tricholoma furcatifolium]
MAATKKSSKPRAPRRALDHAQQGVATDDTPATPDVDAPRKTRNQTRIAEAPPPGTFYIHDAANVFDHTCLAAPRPQPRRRAPGKQPAIVDESFIIQRASGTQPHADAPATPVATIVSNSAPSIPAAAVSAAPGPATENLVSGASIPPAAPHVSAAPVPPAAPFPLAAASRVDS